MRLQFGPSAGLEKNGVLMQQTLLLFESAQGWATKHAGLRPVQQCRINHLFFISEVALGCK